jgi:hypothetical protein
MVAAFMLYRSSLASIARRSGGRRRAVKLTFEVGWN